MKKVINQPASAKKPEPKKTAPKKEPVKKQPAKKTSSPKPIAMPEMKNFPSLKKGSKQRNYITLLQTNLINRGYYDGPINGIYGDELEKAVMEFQKDLGKPISGSVGPKTWEQLQESKVVRIKEEPAPVPPPPPPKPNFRVVVEGLTRYQAELLVMLFKGGVECRII